MPDGWGWNLATIVAVGSAATVVTLMGLLVSLLFSIRSSNAARDAAAAATKQTALAQREYELRVRPWLNVSHGEVVFKDEHLTFTAVIKNLGLAPALDSRIGLDVWVPGEPLHDAGQILAAIIYPDVTFDAVFGYGPNRDLASGFNSKRILAFRVNIKYAFRDLQAEAVIEGEFQHDNPLKQFTMRVTQAT